MLSTMMGDLDRESRTCLRENLLAQWYPLLPFSLGGGGGSGFPF